MTAVQGTVVRSGDPVAGAYVRLLGPSGEFVSERRTLEDGAFQFNVAPGLWTLRWFLPDGPEGSRSVELAEGQVAREQIEIA